MRAPWLQKATWMRSLSAILASRERLNQAVPYQKTRFVQELAKLVFGMWNCLLRMIGRAASFILGSEFVFE